MEVVGIATGRKYKVRALTFGERNEILDNAHFLSEEGSVRVKSGTMRMMQIKFGVVEPKLKDEEIVALPEEEGRQLCDAIAGMSRIPFGRSQQSSSSTQESAPAERESRRS